MRGLGLFSIQVFIINFEHQLIRGADGQRHNIHRLSLHKAILALYSFHCDHMVFRKRRNAACPSSLRAQSPACYSIFTRAFPVSWKTILPLRTRSCAFLFAAENCASNRMMPPIQPLRPLGFFHIRVKHFIFFPIILNLLPIFPKTHCQSGKIGRT